MIARPPVRGTSESLFWRAIEMAALCDLDEDLYDVGRFVASRGESAVSSFYSELRIVLEKFRDAGVDNVLRRYAVTLDGRPFSELADEELDLGLQSFLLWGRAWCDRLIADPSLVAGPGPQPFVNLSTAVEHARRTPEIDERPLWVEREGDRRRDGDLWIRTDHATGVGVPGFSSSPWADRGVLERFWRAAVLRSLDDAWREWRDVNKIRVLDLWIEYVDPHEERERIAVTRRGRITQATVYRNFARFSGSGSSLQIARQEADRVFDLALQITS